MAGEQLKSVALHQVAAEGLTQKQCICHALVAAGVPMDPSDLEDRAPRRRAAA